MLFQWITSFSSRCRLLPQLLSSFLTLIFLLMLLMHLQWTDAQLLHHSVPRHSVRHQTNLTSKTAAAASRVREVHVRPSPQASADLLSISSDLKEQRLLFAASHHHHSKHHKHHKKEG